MNDPNVQETCDDLALLEDFLATFPPGITARSAAPAQASDRLAAIEELLAGHLSPEERTALLRDLVNDEPAMQYLAARLRGETPAPATP